METILCNSIVVEDGVVVDGWKEYETTHSVDLPLNKPLRRGGPWCPPAPFDTDWSLLMSMFTLAGWMHRVCADLAGCYETSVLSMVRLGWCVA